MNTTQFVQQSDSRGKETVVRTGVGSAIGAAIGAIAGGGKGAAIGAGVGGATSCQVLTKGERVKIPSETVLTLATDGSATPPPPPQNPPSPTARTAIVKSSEAGAPPAPASFSLPPSRF